MIYLILLFGITLRFISLNQSLWLDEAINVIYAQNNDLWWFITRYPIGDFHPPGWFAILWVWSHIFGFSEISVRLPSLILGIGTIFLTYLIGKKIFTPKVGLISAVILALSPLHLYYSQEARMYSLAAFAVTLSMYFFVRLMKNEKFGLAGLILSTVLIFYADYVAYLIIPVQLLFILIFYRDKLIRYLISLLCSLFFLLPWMLIFPEQLSNGQNTANTITEWRNIVGGSSIKNGLMLPVKILVGRISFDNNILYGGLIIIISLPYLFIFRQALGKFKTEKFPSLVLFWLLFPPLLGLAISFLVPIFAYFRFIFILPAFSLLVAWAIENLKAGRTKSILLSILILFELTAVIAYLYTPHFQRENWREAVNFVENNASSQTVVLFENNEFPAPFLYYRQNKVDSIVPFKSVPATDFDQLVDLEKLLQGKQDIYLFEYLVDITDPDKLLEKKLHQMGFTRSSVQNFEGVGFVKLYQRNLLE